MQFESMVQIIPPGTAGVAEVRHWEADEETARRSRFRAAAQLNRELAVEPGRYAQLFVRGSLVMSDTQMEQDSNWDVVYEARGDVLIAGLGLGMILVPILRKPKVRTVTVVEKEMDVVRLVEPYVRRVPGGEKLMVVRADILQWKPRTARSLDVIYFDIWPEIPTSWEHRAEMQALRRRFAPYLRKGGWSRCWKQEEAGRW